jgi:hypothetical protein
MHEMRRGEEGVLLMAEMAGKLTYIECPCCGDDGAASDGEGWFLDGQPLICGCPGWVSVDSDGDDEPYINNGDAECLKCGAIKSG